MEDDGAKRISHQPTVAPTPHLPYARSGNDKLEVDLGTVLAAEGSGGGFEADHAVAGGERGRLRWRITPQDRSTCRIREGRCYAGILEDVGPPYLRCNVTSL